MGRNKYIVFVTLLLLIVLVVAFTIQIRRLQKQLRSSVRIVPAESKLLKPAYFLFSFRLHFSCRLTNSVRYPRR